MAFQLLSDSSYESLECPSSSPPVVYYEVVPAGYNYVDTAINCSPNTPPFSGGSSNEQIIEATRTPIKNFAPSNSIVDYLKSVDITTLIFFDLETTGLAREIGESNVQITEISMVAVSKKDFESSPFPDLKNVRVVNKLSICVKPRTRVSPGAAKITGLDDSNLIEQQPFNEDIAQMIHGFVVRLPQPVCFLAHNGYDYDFPLLKAELKRLGKQLPDNVLIADTLIAFRTVGLFDAVAQPNNQKTRRKTASKFRPYSLQNLHYYFFKKKAINSHSSEGDCKALMMVCHKMKDKVMPWVEQNKGLFSAVKPMW